MSNRLISEERAGAELGQDKLKLELCCIKMNKLDRLKNAAKAG